MPAAFARRASPGDGTRVGLHLLDKVANGLNLGGGGDGNGHGLTSKAGDGGDVGQGHRRSVGQDRADHHIAADDQLLGVAIGRSHELGKAHRAACAGNVLDLNVARDAFRRHHLLNGAGGRIPATAGGRGGHDHVVFGETGSCSRNGKHSA